MDTQCISPALLCYIPLMYHYPSNVLFLLYTFHTHTHTRTHTHTPHTHTHTIHTYTHTTYTACEHTRVHSIHIKTHIQIGILDFYFMLGPEPEAVVQQYHEIIGRPHMPPYWSLGWHQGRYGFQNIKDVEGVTKRYSENQVDHILYQWGCLNSVVTNQQIPLEAVWSDIDHMDDVSMEIIDTGKE